MHFSESTIESAKEEINSEETTTTTTNEAAVCSTSEQPQELTEEVTKDEEQVNSSCEALPTIPSPPKNHTVSQNLQKKIAFSREKKIKAKKFVKSNGLNFFREIAFLAV